MVLNWFRTVDRKSSLEGLYVHVGGLYVCAGEAWYLKFGKISNDLQYSVSYFDLGGLVLCLGGGDGTELVISRFSLVFAGLDRSRYIARLTALWVTLSLLGALRFSIQWIGKWLYRRYQNLRVLIGLVHGNVIPVGIPRETSHGMGRDSTHLYFPWDSEIEWESQNVTELLHLDYTSEF